MRFRERMMDNQNVLVIEAGRTERHYWKDLWRYRELFYFLAWRDILVRYKQTVIGLAWALIRPLLDDGCVCVRLQQTGQTAFRRCALSDSGLCSASAMAIFFQRIYRSRQQFDQQCQHDLQSLLPPLGGTDQCSDREFCRLSDFGDHFGRADDLVWFCA